MLSLCLIAVGVLSLLQSSSTFVLPGATVRRWQRVGAPINPTIQYPGLIVMHNKPLAGSSAMAQLASQSPSTNPPVHPTGQGILLNDLKTGLKLNGVVASSTPYAAFIDAGIRRIGKGGAILPVNAMLHKSDISPVALAALQKLSAPPGKRFDGPKPLLEKNTPVVVYVKEVFKQSGRFTVTTDPEVRKENIVEDHERIRLEGLERRRTRRLRRQLEEVSAGTTVTGYVDRVVPEGVLVTVTSLGSLNVTGLILKKDLPIQFQVPSNLKDVFQVQLLQQDFMPGREVVCGVSQVHPNPSSTLTYNMKLQFEEFGTAPDDELHFVDKFDSMTEQEKDAIITNRKFAFSDADDAADDSEGDAEISHDGDGGDDEEGDFEDEFGDFETEVKEIYEELLAASNAALPQASSSKGKQLVKSSKTAARPRSELLVQDLYDWEALQEMLEEGAVTNDDVEDALRLVGANAGGTLSLAQFQGVVEILQEGMEEAADLVDDGEEPDAAGLAEQGSQQARLGASGRDDNVSGYAAEDDDEEDDEGDDDEEEELSAGEEFEEMLHEVYDELKGKDGKVTVKAFKAWADIQDMLTQGVLDIATLDSMIQEVVGAAPQSAPLKSNGKSVKAAKAAKEPTLDFEQFSQLVQDLDEVAGEDDDFEDSDYTDEDDQDDDGAVVPREIFDSLTKGAPKLKVKDFAAWEEVQELMRDEELGTEDLKAFVAQVGSTMKGELDYEQFCELFDLILNPDGNADGEEEGDDSGALDTSAGTESTDDVDDAAESEQDRAITMELFDELRGKKEKVSVKDFIAWDEVQALLDDEYLDMESLEALLQTVGSSKTSQLDYEQFSDLLGIIEDTVEDMESEEYGSGDEDSDADMSGSMIPSAGQVSASLDQREANRKYASKSSAIEAYDQQFDDDDGGDITDDDGDDSDPSDEELEDMARLVFDELLPKGRSTVPVKAFVAWNGIQDEIAAGSLKSAELKKVIKSVDKAGKGELNFEQFLAVMDQVEVIIEDRVNPGQDDEESQEIELPQFSASAQPAARGSGMGFGATPPAPVTAAAPTKKGSSKMANNADEDAFTSTQKEIDALSAEIYAEIKGKAKLLSIQKLKEWSDLQEMIENGELKRSALEQALVKIGAAATGTLTLQQFNALLDILQNKVDDSSFDTSLLEDKIASLQAANSAPIAPKAPAIPSSTRARIASAEELASDRQFKSQRSVVQDIDLGVDNDHGEEDDEADEGQRFESDDGLHDFDLDDGQDAYDDVLDEEDGEAVGRQLTEEEAAREVYEELRQGKRSATLGDFLEWEDLQELLEVGALTKDQLAQAIENSRANVQLGDQSALSFEAFHELIQIIDHHVDRSKLDHAQDDLVFEQNISVEGLQDAEGVMNIIDKFNTKPAVGDTRISYKQPSGTLHHGDAAINAMQADSSQSEKANESSDIEILEMFQDLSKGKGYITEKALRKWDEVQGLVDAEIASQEVIDSMFARVQVENGRVSLPAFRQFIGMLDTVLVDDAGNILSFDEQDRAVDLDGVDDEEQ